MKYFLLCLLALSSASSYGESCLESYTQKVKDKEITFHRSNGEPNNYNVAIKAGALFTTGATIGIIGYGLSAVTPVGWVLLAATPTVLGFTTIYNISKTNRYKRMIKLIEQSYEFKDDLSLKPKRLLRKLFSKIPSSNNISLEELADSIIEGNEKGTLCDGNKSYRQLKREYGEEKR